MGEWMRILFVTPDRELDPTQRGMAIAPPPMPAPQIQTSSEPSPSQEPVNRAQSPRLWFRGGDADRTASSPSPPLIGVISRR